MLSSSLFMIQKNQQNLLYFSFYLLTSSNVVALIPAILLAVAVYFALLILFRGMTESELRAMPKGHLLVKAAKKCRLMK